MNPAPIRLSPRWLTPLVVILVIAVGGVVAWWQLRPATTPLDAFAAWRMDNPALTAEQQQQAKTEFEQSLKVLRANADDFSSWMALGNAKLTVKDYEGAAAIFEYAGKIRPLNSISFNNLGHIYSTFLRRNDAAVAAYQRAIANSADEPLNEFYVRNLGDLQDLTMGDPASALATFEEGLRRLPQSKQLLARAAEVAAKLGDRSKAIGYYTRLLAIDPGNAAAKDELAKLQ